MRYIGIFQKMEPRILLKPYFETSISFEPFGICLCSFHCSAQENELYHYIDVCLYLRRGFFKCRFKALILYPDGALIKTTGVYSQCRGNPTLSTSGDKWAHRLSKDRNCVPVTWNFWVVYGSCKGQILRTHEWACRVNPRNFLLMFDTYRRRSACAWKLSIHNVHTGATYILGPYKVHRQSCWDRTGALMGPVVWWVLWASYRPR